MERDLPDVDSTTATGIMGPKPSPQPDLERPQVAMGQASALEFSVVLQRFDRCPLGLSLAEIDGKIQIVGLGDGIVFLWNQKNEERAIGVQDFLVEVNGISQDVQYMLRELRSAQVLQLRLRREGKSLQDEEVASRQDSPGSRKKNQALHSIEILLEEKEAHEDQIREQKLAMLSLSILPGPHDDQVWNLAAEWCMDHTLLYEDVGFVKAFGFHALDSKAWGQVQETRLELHVVEHVEMAGHTWYIVQCSLQPNVDTSRGLLTWQAPRRLQQLRGDLHNRLKHINNEENYYRIFKDTPFPHVGGVPGTTARLKAWLASLAAAASRLQMSPAEVAYTLLFFHAPLPGSIPMQLPL